MIDIRYFEVVVKSLFLAFMACITCIHTWLSIAVGVVILFIEKKYAAELTKTIMQKTGTVILKNQESDDI